jgi:hypothetical protein
MALGSKTGSKMGTRANVGLGKGVTEVVVVVVGAELLSVLLFNKEKEGVLEVEGRGWYPDTTAAFLVVLPLKRDAKPVQIPGDSVEGKVFVGFARFVGFVGCDCS